MEENNMNMNGTQEGQQNNGQVQQGQPVAQNAPTQQTGGAPQPQIVVVQEQKENWFKRNWKKILAGTAAVGGVVGSAFVAYNKGKKAGAVCYPPSTNEEDYTLNPNV